MNRGWMIWIAAGILILCAGAYWMNSLRTEYAPKYSAGAFRQIKAGISIERVKQLIGEPLGEYRVTNQQRLILDYSAPVRRDSPWQIGWYERSVEFSNKVVTRVTAKFVSYWW